MGADVDVESGMGDSAGFSDQDYIDAGASIHISFIGITLRTLVVSRTGCTTTLELGNIFQIIGTNNTVVTLLFSTIPCTIFTNTGSENGTIT